MKKTILSTLTLALVLFFSGCNQQSVATPKKAQNEQTREDIRIMSSANSDGKLTAKSIEDAFKANGFTIVGNNDMNKPFKDRFGAGEDFKMYRLMFVHNPEISTRIINKYPQFGLLSPLSTSVYSKDGSKISISSLTITGMSRITGVPKNDPDLIALYESMTKALAAAMPNGAYEKLNYKITRPEGEIITKFKFELPNESDDIEEAKETFQESMEGAIETLGFIVAGFYPIQEDLVAKKIDDYDFYDTYAICKLEVIYPIHKVHPEVGAFAPCTLFMYKKKGEKFTYMGYPSVYNWILSTNIEDEESLTPLIDAQNMLEFTIDDTIQSME